MNQVVAIACGGTGGHFYPGLAIGRELRERSAGVVLFIAGQNQARQLEVARDNGFTAIPADAVRLPRSAKTALEFATGFPKAIFAHSKAMKEHGVTAALGMGSFASAPLCLAAKKRGLPLFLHEGNTTAGKANRKFASMAKCLMTAFPLTNAPPKANTQVVGMPLRQELVAAANEPCPPERQRELRQSLGLDPDLPTILVFGGSQGAQKINQAVIETCEVRKKSDIQLMWLTGTDDNDELKTRLKNCGVRNLVEPRTQDMATRYLASDAVICRAGASSITELALFGRAPLLIPLPTAADNHQQTNADWAVATDGAECCPQSDFTPDFLGTWLSNFLSEPEVWHKKGQNLAGHAKPNAAKDAVDILLK